MWKFLKNLEVGKQAAMMSLIMAILTCIAAYSNLSPMIPDLLEDSPLEEAIEHKIKENTGLDLDFSKDSKEE